MEQLGLLLQRGQADRMDGLLLFWGVIGMLSCSAFKDKPCVKAVWEHGCRGRCCLKNPVLVCNSLPGAQLWSEKPLLASHWWQELPAPGG